MPKTSILSPTRRAMIGGALATWPVPALAQRAPVITLLGDSITAGFGLPASAALPAQLQAELRRLGSKALIRGAGVSGDTTAGGRARLDWSLDGKTTAVMIELGGNDILRGLPPETARENLDAMLAEVTGRGLPVLLIGVKAPSNYGPEYQAKFDAIWPELAAKYHALLLPDLLAPIAAVTPEERAARGLMQADGLHPAPAGVTLVVAALGPKVLELLAQARR